MRKPVKTFTITFYMENPTKKVKDNFLCIPGYLEKNLKLHEQSRNVRHGNNQIKGNFKISKVI